MSKLNVQMTFAAIFTLAFIFYPVIGYSQSGGDYFYDSRQRVCTGQHPINSLRTHRRHSTIGPASRNFKVLRYKPARDRPLKRASDRSLLNSGAAAFVQDRARDAAIEKLEKRVLRNAPRYIQKVGRFVNPIVSEVLFPPKIGQEPLLHPIPPSRRGKIDQGWGSYAPSSSRGSRTRSSSDRASMWDTGARIRDNQSWRESVRRRDRENTRPGEDKFQRADRLNYGPRTREELNIAPGTPKDPPNQTKLNPLEN